MHSRVLSSPGETRLGGGAGPSQPLSPTVKEGKGAPHRPLEVRRDSRTTPLAQTLRRPKKIRPLARADPLFVCVGRKSCPSPRGREGEIGSFGVEAREEVEGSFLKRLQGGSTQTPFFSRGSLRPKEPGIGRGVRSQSLRWEGEGTVDGGIRDLSPSFRRDWGT